VLGLIARLTGFSILRFIRYILLGVDKFMSECRALTNLIGNGVATIVISRWEGELDAKALHDTMAHPITIGEEMERLPA
jgi:aerobic C4-dicarboxylate transport protein